MSKQMPSTVVRAAKLMLRRLGFTPVGKYYVSAPLTADAFAFMSLDARRDYAAQSLDEFYLQASFGLRLESMHRRFSELSGWGESPEFVAISYCPMRSGVPHSIHEWPVSRSSKQSALEPFIHQVESSILPALREVADPIAASKALLEDKSGVFSWPAVWWNPIAYITLGLREEALRYAEQQLADVQSSSSNESFVANYLAYVKRIRSLERDG